MDTTDDLDFFFPSYDGYDEFPAFEAEAEETPEYKRLQKLINMTRAGASLTACKNVMESICQDLVGTIEQGELIAIAVGDWRMNQALVDLLQRLQDDIVENLKECYAEAME